jgi:hypothetical protein
MVMEGRADTSLSRRRKGHRGEERRAEEEEGGRRGSDAGGGLLAFQVAWLFALRCLLEAVGDRQFQANTEL